MTGEYDGDGENTVVILPDKEFVEDARVMIVRTKRVTGGCNGSRDLVMMNKIRQSTSNGSDCFKWSDVRIGLDIFWGDVHVNSAQHICAQDSVTKGRKVASLTFRGRSEAALFYSTTQVLCSYRDDSVLRSVSRPAPF